MHRTLGSNYNTNPMTSPFVFRSFDSDQFLPVSDENFIRHSPPQTQPAAHSRVSAFTLVTANSLEDSWHLCVFTRTATHGHLYLEILHVHLLMPTFFRLLLLRLRSSVLRSLLVPGLKRCLLLGLQACIRIRPVVRRGGAVLLLIPVQVQVVSFLAGEEMVGLILQRLRWTPDHRPQRCGCDLGCDGQLDRQGVHLFLALNVVTVTGGGLYHQSDQEKGDEGSQSCDRRDGAGRQGGQERIKAGGVTEELLEKRHRPEAPCTTSTAQTLISIPAITQNDILCICILYTPPPQKLSILPSLHRFALFTETPLLRSSLSVR